MRGHVMPLLLGWGVCVCACCESEPLTLLALNIMANVAGTLKLPFLMTASAPLFCYLSPTVSKVIFYVMSLLSRCLQVFACWVIGARVSWLDSECGRTV